VRKLKIQLVRDSKVYLYPSNAIRCLLVSPWTRDTCVAVEPTIPLGELHLASVHKLQIQLSDVLKLISSSALSVAGGSNSGTLWLLFSGFISHVKCQTSAPGSARRQLQNRSSESLILSIASHRWSRPASRRVWTNFRSVREFYANHLDFFVSCGRKVDKLGVARSILYALFYPARCFRLVAA
jgi:hypothetical protein